MLGPSPKQGLISLGNETFDKFLGGGLLNSSLNIFERQGPSSRLLDPILHKSLAATTLASKNNVILVNFNTISEITSDTFATSLPLPRKVKSDILYKDIRGKSATAKIKIAWRYSSRNMSPSDSALTMNQVDFGLPLVKETNLEDRGAVSIINVQEDFNMNLFFAELGRRLEASKTTQKPSINIIFKDLLHPFSPMIDNTQLLLKFLYTLRCFARTIEKGAVLISYDVELCKDHASIRSHLYNIADCVVAFYSYETGENKLTGYKNIDGTVEYVKVPKINSFGLHFQQELSDWGYRLTKNHRFFVVDELSLPPCLDDDESKKKQVASEIANIDERRRHLEQVGPLEDFRDVAVNVIAKKL